MTCEKNNNPDYEVIIGTDKTSSQYGIIAKRAGTKIAMDLDRPFTCSIFGNQGSGKSYNLGSITEMATTQIPGINSLEQPLASVFFHYSSTQTYSPELCSMVNANTDENQIEKLRTLYGANPKSLDDVVMLTSPDKVEDRAKEFPKMEVYPLNFSSDDLQASQWRILMGAVGNQSTYIRKLFKFIRNFKGRLTVDLLREEIENLDMPEQTINAALARLDVAEQYINDTSQISSLLKPGRIIIVDIRDEFIEKDDALGLFMVLLNFFSEARFQNQSFNKLIIFDEFHKYTDNIDMIKELSEMIREMRHRGTSIILSSQDPPSVPIELIELSSIIFLHKFSSPNWLKHIKQANTALNGLTPEMMNTLHSGEAYVWANQSSEVNYTRQPYKICCRPRVTKHGGETVLATSGN